MTKEFPQQDTVKARYWKEVTLLFLRLGVTSFGGPAAYIALMQEEVVRRRHWIDNENFLDMVAAVNLIPGPNATEMALTLGMDRAGWRGYLSGGLLFTLPGVLVTLTLAWVYTTYGSLPQVSWILYGVKPVIIAVILQALWDLGRTAVKGPLTAVTGIAILAFYLLGFNEIALLFGGAAFVLLFNVGRRLIKNGFPVLALAAAPFKIVIPVLEVAAVPFSQLTMFLSFLKIGAVLYGSGYVLIAFFNTEFVERLGWLTKNQLLDAIAAGQVSPGPLFTSATFVGYLLGGWQAALLATLAIFLPSFVFVIVLHRWLPVFTRSAWARVFLDGVKIAALSLMAGVTWQLGRAAITDWFTIVLTVLSLILVLRFRVNSVWLILGGGLTGIGYKLFIG